MILLLLACFSLPTPAASASREAAVLELQATLPQAQSHFALPLAIFVQLPPSQEGCRMLAPDPLPPMRSYAKANGPLQLRVVQASAEGIYVHREGGMQRLDGFEHWELSALHEHLEQLDIQQRETVALCLGPEVISFWNYALVIVDPEMRSDQLWAVLDAFEGTQIRPVIAVSPATSEPTESFGFLGGRAAYVSLGADGMHFTGSQGESARPKSVDEGISSLGYGVACARITAEPELSSAELLKVMAEFQSRGHQVILDEAPASPLNGGSASKGEAIHLDLGDSLSLLQVNRSSGANWKGGECGGGAPSDLGGLGGLLGGKSLEVQRAREGQVELDLAVEKVAGPLDASIATRSLNGRRSGAEACVKQAMVRDPSLEYTGQLSWRLGIDADGAYQTLDEGEISFADPQLSGCFASWLAESPLPSPGEASSFELTLRVVEATPPTQDGWSTSLGPPPPGQDTPSGTGFDSPEQGTPIGQIGGDPIVHGELDRSLIDQVVKRNMNKIRYCYQRELVKDPKLAGKLVVKFVIAPDGTVSSATTKSTTMNNSSVESCINSRFMRFQFPEPKNGGSVTVSYPFVFSPS